MNDPAVRVKFRYELIEETAVLNFVLAPCRPCDEVRQLNTTRRFRINEQRNFRQIPKVVRLPLRTASRGAPLPGQSCPRAHALSVEP